MIKVFTASRAKRCFAYAALLAIACLSGCASLGIIGIEQSDVVLIPHYSLASGDTLKAGDVIGELVYAPAGGWFASSFSIEQRPAYRQSRYDYLDQFSFTITGDNKLTATGDMEAGDYTVMLTVWRKRHNNSEADPWAFVYNFTIQEREGAPAVAQTTPAQAAAPSTPAEIPENPETDFEVTITDDGKGVLIERYVGESKNVRIPQMIQDLPVLEIGNRAFNNSNAVNVIIQEGVTRIHGTVRVGSILEGAFSGNNIVSVTLPESLTELRDYTFVNASALRSIVIPDSIKELPVGLFYGCGSLESVTLPEGLTTIGSLTFARCYALASFTIPETVTRIHGGAFSRSGLASITWSARLRMIENDPVNGNLGMFENCENLRMVILPEGVTAIADNAFTGCTALTSVTLPSTLRSISLGAFRNCSALTTIIIPDTVTAIAFDERQGTRAAFYGCGAIPLVTQALLRRLGYKDEF